MNLRKSQVAEAIVLFALVLAEDIIHLRGMAYLALLSLIPLFYGMKKDSRYLFLFPVILAFAYVPVVFIYTLNLWDIAKMAVIWPLFFALFSTLSYPESGDLEKKAMMGSAISSAIALFGIAGAMSISSPITNVFILAAISIIAGISMIYMVYG